MTCFRVVFFSGLFFNHVFLQVFITTDIYIKRRYLFMLISATCFFLLPFMSYQLDFHASNGNNKTFTGKVLCTHMLEILFG